MDSNAKRLVIWGALRAFVSTCLSVLGFRLVGSFFEDTDGFIDLFSQESTVFEHVEEFSDFHFDEHTSDLTSEVTLGGLDEVEETFTDHLLLLFNRELSQVFGLQDISRSSLGRGLRDGGTRLLLRLLLLTLTLLTVETTAIRADHTTTHATTSTTTTTTASHTRVGHVVTDVHDLGTRSSLHHEGSGHGSRLADGTTLDHGGVLHKARVVVERHVGVAESGTNVDVALLTSSVLSFEEGVTGSTGLVDSDVQRLAFEHLVVHGSDRTSGFFRGSEADETETLGVTLIVTHDLGLLDVTELGEFSLEAVIIDRGGDVLDVEVGIGELLDTFLDALILDGTLFLFTFILLLGL